MATTPEALARTDEWVNIPPVVHTAVTAVWSEVQRQRDAVTSLQRAVEDKPGFGDLSETCGGKASLEELRATAASVRAEANRKHDSVTSALAALASENKDLRERLRATDERVRAQGEELAALRAQMESKADASALQFLATTEQLHEKADAMDVQSRLASKVGRDEVEAVLARKADANDLEELAKVIQEKADRREIAHHIEENVERLRSRIQALSEEIRHMGGVVDGVQRHVEGLPTREVLEESLKKRVTVTSVETRIGRAVNAVQQTLQREWQDALREVEAEVKQKATRTEVKRKLETKAERDEIRALLAQKADTAVVVEALRRKADHGDVSALRLAVAEGAGVGGSASEGWSEALARVEALLADKADAEYVSRVASVLGEKASEAGLESVERRLGQLEAAAQELRGRTERAERAAGGAESAARAAEDARDLAEHVAEEQRRWPRVVMARWIWKSRELTPASLVPWDVEAANTSSDQLQWKHQSPTVTAVKPGLYRVALGFFAGRVPAITLLVNGAPAFSTEPEAGAGGSGGGGTVVLHRHPAGSVAGLTLVQFLALPARAALTVLFDGEVRGQGFMEIRKV